MSQKKYAFVTGAGYMNYTLVVVPGAATADHYHLNGLIFPTYRAAQDIANAIHAYCVSKQAQLNRMQRFNSYEISKMAELPDTPGDLTYLYIQPVEKTPEHMLETAVKVFWSLYGVRTGTDTPVEHIADRNSYEDIHALYFALTGHDVGSSEPTTSRLFGLPA